MINVNIQNQGSEEVTVATVDRGLVRISAGESQHIISNGDLQVSPTAAPQPPTEESDHGQSESKTSESKSAGKKASKKR